MSVYSYKFDFEIGSLIKSPCRNCPVRENFPKCIDDCVILDKIHTMMARGVSCTRNFSTMETFAVSTEEWKRKK